MDLTEKFGGMYIPSLDEGIPDKVTKKDLQGALDAYAIADKDYRESVKRRDLARKEDAGDNLYRLVKAFLRDMDNLLNDK